MSAMRSQKPGPISSRRNYTKRSPRSPLPPEKRRIPILPPGCDPLRSSRYQWPLEAIARRMSDRGRVGRPSSDFLARKMLEYELRQC